MVASFLLLTDVGGRAGGRTAWSSTVSVYGQSFAARYWYDGKNLNNAKEDAAEMALTWLNGGSGSGSGSASASGSSW